MAKGAHWYFIYCHECPLCGKTDEYRERRYTPRPAEYEDRHEFEVMYDNCGDY